MERSKEDARVIVRCSHNIAESVEAAMRESFEIEMLQGEVKKEIEETIITFTTTNVGKIRKLHRNIRQLMGTPKPSMN